MKHTESYGRCARCKHDIKYCTCITGIYFLKLIIVITAIVLLCSCGSQKKGRIAEEMSTIKFDLELLGGEISHIDKQMSSSYFVDGMMYSVNNISADELVLKRDKAKKLTDEYKALARVRTRISIKMIDLKVKYDSLQTEYNKY